MKRLFGKAGNEKGWSLVEVLIAVAILALVAVAFLGGLSASSKAVFTADELNTARNIAEKQMEYVMNQDYDGVSPYEYSQIDLSDYTGYTIDPITESSPYNNVVEMAPSATIHYQKIIIKVFHNGGSQPVITLEDYKVQR